MRTLQTCVRALLMTVAVVSLCAMSLLTVIDATGRYLFNRPLTGSVELVELLMVALIFSSLPLVTAARGHITVDIVAHSLPARLQRWQTVFADLVALVISAGLAWVTLKKAASTAEYGDMTPMLNIPLAPFVYVMAITLALDALTHARNLATALRPLHQEPTHD